ncbi:MAG: DUF5667 domain-containing protein [Chloroflexales bacterium]
MTDPSHSIEEALDICLTHMHAGKSAEACLRDFPEYARDLAPLLATVTHVQSWTPPKLPMRVRIATRRRARAALRRTYHSRATWGWGGWVLRMGTAVLLAIALFEGGVAFAGNSLPGSPLYGLKRVGESARLALVRNNADRARLNLNLAQVRVDEMIAVARANQKIDSQILSDLDASYLAAAQAITEVDPAEQNALLMHYRTQIAAQRSALMEAQDSRLPDATRQSLGDASRAGATADAVLADLEPTPTHAPSPTPTLVATPSATIRVTKTAIPSPWPSATPSATPSAEPSDTPVPVPSSTPMPAPTLRPTEYIRRHPTLTLPPPPPTNEPPTNEPPTNEPPTNEPPTEKSPAERPPTERPPTERPPTERPPTDTRPTGDTPATPTGNGEHGGATPESTPHNPDNKPPPETRMPEPGQTESPAPHENNTPEPRNTDVPEPTDAATSRPENPTDVPQHHETHTPLPSHPETPEPSHPKTPEPSHPETPEPSHPKTPEPNRPETPEPSHPKTPEPSHPETPKPKP